MSFITAAQAVSGGLPGTASTGGILGKTFAGGVGSVLGAARPLIERISNSREANAESAGIEKLDISSLRPMIGADNTRTVDPGYGKLESEKTPEEKRFDMLNRSRQARIRRGENPNPNVRASTVGGARMFGMPEQIVEREYDLTTGALKSNVPPPPSSQAEQFSQPVQQSANRIFGDLFARQNAVGAPMMFKINK